MRERFSGIVKSFDASTGSGFIEVEAGDAFDVFVHWFAPEVKGFQSLRPGQAIEFSIEKGPKGPKAVDLVIKTGSSG
jgi:cold shock protein